MHAPRMKVTAEQRGGRRLQSTTLRMQVHRGGVSTVARFTVLKVVTDQSAEPRVTLQADEDGRTTLRLVER